MDVKRSELQQELFAIVDSSVSIEYPVGENGAEADDLDIDLSIFHNKEDDHLVRIYYKITAKRCYIDEVGIEIAVQATCDFRIDKSIEIDTPDFFNLIHYSATAITYSNIRAYLQNITSYYPVEPYILPAIDLKDLCKKYSEKMENKSKSETSE